MNSHKKIKWDLTKILLAIFTIFLVVFGIFMLNRKNVAEIDTEGLSLIETINSGIQRVSKLELENNHDETLIITLYNIAEELVPENGQSKYFVDNKDIIAIVEDFVEELEIFEDAINVYLEDGNRNALFQASENNYTNTAIATNIVSKYVQEEVEHVSRLEIYIIIDVIIMALLLLRILFTTANELKHNKELSKEMFIDTSTGLYNRSKCQEILKSTADLEDTKERAIIIFDLNDLKKTNDGLGHRAGDDLISSFASQIKKATDVFAYEVFVGRYGGDEFMAYFDSCEEKDIELYLKEVDYQLENFNDTEGKPFKLSCAAGYCITTPETKSMTMREIFDTADGNMYKNKIAMKEKKKQELLAQGIQVEEVKDDRL